MYDFTMRLLVAVLLLTSACATASSASSDSCADQHDRAWVRFLGGMSGNGDSTAARQRSSYCMCKFNEAKTAEERDHWLAEAKKADAAVGVARAREDEADHRAKMEAEAKRSAGAQEKQAQALRELQAKKYTCAPAQYGTVTCQ